MKKSIIYLILGFALLSNTLFSQAKVEEATFSCKDCACMLNGVKAIAPIGVMNDHYHYKNGWMASYRFMQMNMSGNLNNGLDVENSSIFENYAMAPKEMNMQMHMVGVMYGLTDRLTLMAMVPYISNNMEMTMMNGMVHPHQSSGIGDLGVSAVFGAMKTKSEALQLNLGLKLPTGAIDQINDMDLPSMHHHEHPPQRMPYPMRLGSGTVDLSIGMTFLQNLNKFNWGVQPGAIIRTGENKLDYRLGNQYFLNLWGSYGVVENLNISLRAKALANGNIKGMDPELNKALSPLADVQNTGGEEFLGFAGINYLLPTLLKGIQVGAEFGWPLYQNPEGIQMNKKSVFTLGVKFDVN